MGFCTFYGFSRLFHQKLWKNCHFSGTPSIERFNDRDWVIFECTAQQTERGLLARTVGGWGGRRRGGSGRRDSWGKNFAWNFNIIIRKNSLRKHFRWLETPPTGIRTQTQSTPKFTSSIVSFHWWRCAGWPCLGVQNWWPFVTKLGKQTKEYFLQSLWKDNVI